MRKIHGESGAMVGAGKRIDHVSCDEVDFKGNASNTAHVVNKASLAFNQLCSRSLFSRSHKKESNNLNKIDCCLDVYDGKESVSHSVMPTHAANEDLTNSLHVDPFDSSYSHALFYLERLKMKSSDDSAHSTLFSFPHCGIGVPMDQPILMSWRGNMMHHCSCTTSPGIYSLFASSNMKVRSLKFAQDLFFKSDSDSIQCVIGQKNSCATTSQCPHVGGTKTCQHKCAKMPVQQRD